MTEEAAGFFGVRFCRGTAAEPLLLGQKICCTFISQLHVLWKQTSFHISFPIHCLDLVLQLSRKKIIIPMKLAILVSIMITLGLFCGIFGTGKRNVVVSPGQIHEPLACQTGKKSKRSLHIRRLYKRFVNGAPAKITHFCLGVSGNLNMGKRLHACMMLYVLLGVDEPP